MKTLSAIAYTARWCLWYLLGKHWLVFLFYWIFLIFDTIVWRYSARLEKKDSSKLLKRGMISKLFVYLFMMIIGAMINMTYPDLTIDDHVFWTLLAILTWGEMISTLRHILFIKTWEEITEHDTTSFIIKKIHSIIRTQIEKVFWPFQ